MLMNMQDTTSDPTAFPYKPCLQDVFNVQVVENPNKIAVIFKDQQLTYRELDQRANQLARHLIFLGVKPDMLVGICVPRSLDMVVGILGIIKAGGAYIPLDPTYPVERLSFILSDAKAQIVVTQNEFLELFSEHEIQTVCLDTDSIRIREYSVSSPDTTTTPDNLVYIIYTSGSTGKPKGVMISHSSLVNFIEISSSALIVKPDDVYLQSASIAYALSVRQLMIPLTVGATIIVASSDEVGDPLELFGLIKRQNVSLMDVVPSFWRSCIQRLIELPQAEQENLLDNSLRRIVSIGETLMSDLPRDWLSQISPKTNLVNIFGQTETTGVVATYPISQARLDFIGVVPIGHSIPRTKLYILDANLQPVPDGEVGELCVSNPCLARGYLNRPELTAEKFIPNPFDDGFSTRLYRTGDMARCREDGNIELLGRGDYQVKIRGQRIELGEVDAILRQNPAVRDCVVVARGDQPDEKYIAAYVVLTAGEKISNVELKDFLRKRLPEYMVPAAFMFLETLPLTPNGKVNRLALPNPMISRGVDQNQNLSSGSILPRTRVEEIITRIWQDFMNLDQVGIHDNFFDLGGHSLLAVRVLARIERDLGVRLPLTSFFHSATIAKLAELVNLKVDETRDWSPVVAIQPYGFKPPFFGVHAHEGGVLFWRDVVDHLPKDQPFYAIQAQGVDGVRPALTRIEDMATLYNEAVRKIQPHGPYYLGGFSMGGEVAFEMAQQLTRQGEKVNFLIMLDTRNPQRLTRPVVRNQDGLIIPDLEAKVEIGRYHLFNRKVKSHILGLEKLNWLEKISYLSGAFSFWLRRSAVYSLAYIYRIMKRRLPDRLLLHYLKLKHSEAIRKYVPVHYPGKITLFRASQSVEMNPADSPMGWAPLAGEGVEAYYFEATHNIVSREYAEKIAFELNECLEKAQTLK
jgi:aspartate racemase